MRVVVMAALHQDFELALELGSKSETKKNYGEDATNMVHFINHLSQLNKGIQNQNYQDTQTLGIFA